MPFHQQGAQRAPSHCRRKLPIVAVVAAGLALGGLSASPPAIGAADATATPAPPPSFDPNAAPVSIPTVANATTPVVAPADASVPDTSDATPTATAQKSRPKVVVVVGPVGGLTARYILRARLLAAQARSYGASVIELYSPNATWAKVYKAAQGANLLVYLGHGNGWPSNHGPYDPANKDGLGLNALPGHGNNDTRYFGESVISRSIRLAPHAVVILNHLCYASGDSEWGRANPTRGTAIARVDNYGAGFLKAGAAAVIADGLDSPSYVIRGLFKTNLTIRQIFWSAGHAARTHIIAFASHRAPGMKAIMDPYRPNRYYRSVIGQLDLRASTWR